MHPLKQTTDFETVQQLILAHLHAHGITPTRLPGVFDTYSVAHFSDFLPGFNKVIIRDNHEIHLSWDSHPTFTKRLISDWMEGTFESVQAPKDAEPDRSARFAEIRTLVDTLFTKSMPRKTVLEPIFFEADIARLNQNYVRKSPHVPDPMMLRVDESRDDLDITLAVSPIDLSVRLGFRRRKGHLFDNPLTRFYIGQYDKGVFEKAEQIDDLGFYEFVGELTFPDNLKNRTAFTTCFEANVPDAVPSRWLERSGGSQMRFIDCLMTTLMVVCGTDIHGRAGIQRDSTELDGNDICFYNFNRDFATPFADIRLLCGLIRHDLPDGEVGFNAMLYVKADIHAKKSPITHSLPIRTDGYFNRKDISPEDLEMLY
jgi:hypothetical protein